MRDKERIPEICNRLKAAWAAHPDWRLGQLIANAVRAETGALNCDPFFIEDDKLIAGIESVSYYDR